MTSLSQRVIGGNGFRIGFVKQSPFFFWEAVFIGGTRGTAAENRAHRLHQASGKAVNQPPSSGYWSWRENQYLFENVFEVIPKDQQRKGEKTKQARSSDITLGFIYVTTVD